MEPLNHQKPEREAQRTQANRDELVERIARATREADTVEPLRGLHFKRVSSSTAPIHGVSIPAFCVIAQGSSTTATTPDTICSRRSSCPS
jgi:hypothetical protein